MYDYPNSQSARLVWYHDHAYGITRLNAYAGLASAYLITDDAESMMIKSGILPDVPGYPLGIPLIIQDKSFFDPASDPTYPVTGARKGDLWYPHRLRRSADPRDEASGAMRRHRPVGHLGRNAAIRVARPRSVFRHQPRERRAVSGASVSPRRYRFQALNAAQARFYNLQLYVARSIS